MWRLSEEMFKDLERMFAMVKEGGLLEELRGMFAGGGPGPRADVYESKERVFVHLEAPGWLQGGHRWSYRLAGGQLLVKGEMDMEHSVQDDRGRYYSERRAESFARFIPLPAAVEDKPCKVEYADGILSLQFRISENGVPNSGWRPIPGPHK